MKNLILFTFSFFSLSFIYAQNPIWKNIGPGAGSDLHYIVIQPDNKDIIYTAGDIEGIFKTTNGGITWNNINNNLAQMPYGAGIYWINEIKIDPINYQKVFICGAVGLFQSNDGGGSWQLIFPNSIDNNNNPTIEVSAIAIDPSNTNRIFLGLGDEAGECSNADFIPFTGFNGPWGVYRSLDGGGTWSLKSTGLPDSISVHTIDVIPNSNIVILASNMGIYRSDDGGNTWFQKNNGLPHTNTHRIKLSNNNGSYVLTLSLKTIGDVNISTTFSGGIFRSYNNGDTWNNITGNLPQYDPYDFLFYDYWKFDISPNDVNNIYAGTNVGSGYDQTGVFETKDGGTNWNLLYTPVIGGWLDTAFTWEGYAYDIGVAPSDPSRIVICRDDVEISNDTGSTWHNAFTTQIGNGWKGNGLELMNTEGIAFDPSNSNKLYIGYDDFGLFRSDNNANSFIRLDYHQSPTYGLLSNIDAAKDIYIDPAATSNIYVERFQGSQGGYLEGWTGGGVVFSTNQGVTFSNITGSMPYGRHDIAVDFVSGTPGNRTIYSAVFHSGMYKSTDNGTTWSAINTGLGASAPYVWDIVINPNNNQELFLAANSWGLTAGGLFKSTNGGSTWIPLTGLIAGDVSKVFINALGDVYAGVSDNFEWNTSGGLYRSSDGGNTFTEILNHSRVVDIQTNPTNPNYIVAVAQQWYNVSTEQHGIYLSNDNGTTWSLISQNANHTFFNFARFNPYNPKQVYAGTAGGGMWVCDSIADITTGQNDIVIDTNSKIIIYPNPSQGKFTLEIQSKFEFKNYDIKILDLLGNPIFEKTLNSKQKKLNMNLPSGIYFYQVKDNKKFISSGKFIVQ